MEVNIYEGSSLDCSADLLVLGSFEGEALTGLSRALDDRLDGHLTKSWDRQEFCGAWLSSWSSLSLGRVAADRVLALGLGKASDFTSHRLRQAMGALARMAGQMRVKSLVFDLSNIEGDGTTLAEALVEGLELGAFKFPGYHQVAAAEEGGLERVWVAVSKERQAGFQRGLDRGAPAAQAQNLVRRLGYIPSSHLYPERLAEVAQKKAEEHGLEVEIFDEKKLGELKMGALLGVGQGSVHPPRMVVMRYRGGPGATLALVGKGITFDSGGISLKPSANMEEMKYDMLGAAAVLGALCTIARWRPAINVIGIMAIAQNMPSGSAYKPGDVVTAFNGKTIEVTNTDAEGRVALADGVSYAVHLGADYIVEASTLTGAALVVLGHEASALVATDDELARVVEEAGARAGERVWRLPIYPEYRDLYKSEVADIKNAPGRDAGTITGGMIISEFAHTVPFAHLDIAGTAWTNKSPLNPDGGPTGVMVRTFAEIAEHLASR